MRTAEERRDSVDKMIREEIDSKFGSYNAAEGLTLQFISQAMTHADPVKQRAAVRSAIHYLEAVMKRERARAERTAQS